MKTWSISAFVMPVVVMGAYILWRQCWDWSVLIALLPVCLMTCGFFRARRSLAAAKISKAAPAGMKPGSRNSSLLYSFEMVFPYVWIGICSIIGILPLHTVIAFLTIAVALACASTMRKSVGQGPTLLADLEVRTASLQIMFSVLLSVAFVAARLF
jgi:1,4-dihydroxy-2-naphthoate octaprenyltransferase